MLSGRLFRRVMLSLYGVAEVPQVSWMSKNSSVTLLVLELNLKDIFTGVLVVSECIFRDTRVLELSELVLRSTECSFSAEGVSKTKDSVLRTGECSSGDADCGNEVLDRTTAIFPSKAVVPIARQLLGTPQIAGRGAASRRAGNGKWSAKGGNLWARKRQTTWIKGWEGAPFAGRDKIQR